MFDSRLISNICGTSVGDHDHLCYHSVSSFLSDGQAVLCCGPTELSAKQLHMFRVRVAQMQHCTLHIDFNGEALCLF